MLLAGEGAAIAPVNKGQPTLRNLVPSLPQTVRRDGSKFYRLPAPVIGLWPLGQRKSRATLVQVGDE